MDVYSKIFNTMRKSAQLKKREPFCDSEYYAYQREFCKVALKMKKDYDLEPINRVLYENIFQYYASRELVYTDEKNKESYGKPISYKIKLDIDKLGFDEDEIKRHIGENKMVLDGRLLTFESEWKKHKGLLIIGATGVGKDYLFRILNVINTGTIQEDLICRKVICESLEEDYKQYGSAIFDQFREGQWNLCDIGKEKGMAPYFGSSINVIAKVINDLYERWSITKMPTIGTTNLSPTSLYLKYGERDFFRMVEMYNFGYMQGRNKRI